MPYRHNFLVSFIVGCVNGVHRVCARIVVIFHTEAFVTFDFSPSLISKLITESDFDPNVINRLQNYIIK